MTPTAAAKTAGGGVTAAYVGLKVVVTAGPNTVTTKVNSATATAVTLAAPCPAGVTATVGLAVIGEPGANAPYPGSAMASLSAELNLNPTLVSTQDDCNKNTFEGFQVIGQWNNPGGYGAGLGAPTIVSVGQISYPTAVISFSAYIRPQPTGDAPARRGPLRVRVPGIADEPRRVFDRGQPDQPDGTRVRHQPDRALHGAGPAHGQR